MSTQFITATASQHQPHRGLRILVVEDDRSVADTLKLLLAHAGYAVDTVLGAKEALEAFGPGKFALVITDHEMPGMKGSELAEILKRRVPSQRVLILTAYPESLRQRAPAVMADLIVSKPFGVTELLALIHQLVSMSPEACAPSNAQ